MYLFISVIPKLEKVFASLQVSLPWYSELLINFSKFLQSKWYLVLGLGAGGAFVFQKWAASKAGSETLDRLFLRLPLLGPLVLRINVSKFTKTLSTLLSSGVPIISALEITKNTIGNSVIATVVEDEKLTSKLNEITSALKPYGPVNFQFRIDREDNLKIFEINGRFSGTTPLRALAGFNEVEMSINHLLGSSEKNDVKIKKLTFLRHWEETIIDESNLEDVRDLK